MDPVNFYAVPFASGKVGDYFFPELLAVNLLGHIARAQRVTQAAFRFTVD
jgi:hypothetical protein